MLIYTISKAVQLGDSTLLEYLNRCYNNTHNVITIQTTKISDEVMNNMSSFMAIQMCALIYASRDIYEVPGLKSKFGG